MTPKSSKEIELPAVGISDKDWNILLPEYVTKRGLGVVDIFILLALIRRGSREIGAIYVP